MDNIRIPRIFHRIWVGKNPMPQEFVEYGHSWEKHHPNWEFMTWTDQNMIPLLNQAEYDKATTPALKSDIARIEILYRFGGVYLDCDFECFKNIEPLLENVDEFAAWQDDYIIATGIMGCIADHPDFQTLTYYMTPHIRLNYEKPLPFQAGPVYLTKLLRKSKDAVIFPKALFYPYYYTEMEKKGAVFSQAYAAHHWAKSWL